MAKTIRGGIYRSGDKYVDSSGKEIAAELIPLSLRSEEEGEASGDLGEDFPGYPALIKAKLTTRAAVAATSDEDLLALNGLGPKTLEEIREALK